MKINTLKTSALKQGRFFFNADNFLSKLETEWNPLNSYSKQSEQIFFFNFIKKRSNTRKRRIMVLQYELRTAIWSYKYDTKHHEYVKS